MGGERARTTWTLCHCLLGALVVLHGADAAVADQRPNFVVIMGDDLGASELACYGHPEHSTPHLDQLAGEGMRFETCYATPVCTPTRVMILTGRYGFRTGWFSFLEKTYSPQPGTPQFDLGASEITFADILKQQGYATGIAGKWQLPGSPKDRIYDCGFDTYCMWMWKHTLPDIDPATGEDRNPYDAAASLHRGKGRGNRYWDPDIMGDRRKLETQPNDYGPDIFAQFVCDFISQHRQQPFCIYYPMVLVHKHGGGLPQVPDLSRPGQRAAGGLKANIQYMDHLVGRVMHTLDELGLRENTYVFFTGDNGSADEGKSEVIERGARVPLIVRGPGIPAGVVSRELVDLTDILPTLAQLAGAPLPSDRAIDGVSLVPTLLQQQGRTREWIFSYLDDQRMLRDQRWLLEGDGRFYDCGDRRDGTNYKDVTNSRDPDVVAARQRFEDILKTLPGPVEHVN